MIPADTQPAALSDSEKMADLIAYYTRRYARCRTVGPHDLAAEYGFLLALPPALLLFLRGGNL